MLAPKRWQQSAMTTAGTSGFWYRFSHFVMRRPIPMAAIVIAIVMAVVIAAFIFLRRDISGLWVAIAGLVTGLIAAAVSAPISAIAFGGVTGSGTDLIVAALRQGGADVMTAAFGQGFFSDPIDKLITSFVVFIIISSLSARFLARFPLGDRLTRPAPAGSVYAGPPSMGTP